MKENLQIEQIQKDQELMVINKKLINNFFILLIISILFGSCKAAPVYSLDDCLIEYKILMQMYVKERNLNKKLLIENDSLRKIKLPN